MSGILQTTTTTQVKEAEKNTVSGQLTFAMQTMQRLVKESSVISIPVGESTSTLKLKMSDSDTNDTDLYTIVYLEDGKIYMQEGNNDPRPITDDSVTVDSLSFMRFTQYPSKDTVQIDIAMTGVAQSGGQVVTRALRSAVSRASAVTFDSDLIPGADNTYQVGNSSYKWQNANFSGDVSVDGQVDAGQLCISGDCKSSWSASGVSGSGTADYIAKWSGSTTLSTSTIYDNGTSVGIGTATPSASYLLDVNGAIRMSGDGLYNSAGYEIIEGDKTDWLRINNGSSYSSGVAAYDDWAFGTGGLAVGSWDTAGSGNIIASGSVAIGTSSASNELTVSGDADVTGSLGIGTATPSSKLDVYNTSDEIMRLSRSTATSTIFRLGTDSVMVINNNGNDTLTLDEGNVGIGTTTPSYVLHGYNSSNADGFMFYSGNQLTGEKDVFIIEDYDTGGGGQDESSVLKVYKSAEFNTADEGSSAIEVTLANSADDSIGYIYGRHTDEGQITWGVDSDETIWTSGGLDIGATGTDCGGTGAACHNSPTFAVASGGNVTITGSVDMSSGTITNLATPTADSDAATKAYVDAASGGSSFGPSSGKIVFVTSDDYTGDLTGLSDADANEGIVGAHRYCNTAAQEAGLPGHYKAWVSINSFYEARDMLDHSTDAYYKLDVYDDSSSNSGSAWVKVADNWTDLTDGTLDSAIDRDEYGTYVTDYVWTGTTTSGEQHTSGIYDCSDWKSTSGSGYIGRTLYSNSGWTSQATAACGTSYHLYCFQQ